MACKYILLMLALVIPSQAFTQTTAKTSEATQLRKPWLKQDTAIVIDPYWANNYDIKKVKTDPRVGAIIHKASQGFTADPKYSARRVEALEHDFRWGSYHLGVAGDGAKQAKFYLSVARPTPDEFIALDLEGVGGKFMTLLQAEQFIKYVADETGRLPVIYMPGNVARAINRVQKTRNTYFDNTQVWLATPNDAFPLDLIQEHQEPYLLWQFETHCKPNACKYRVPGTPKDMDVNVYWGNVEKLRKEWPFTNCQLIYPDGTPRVPPEAIDDPALFNPKTCKQGQQ